MRGEQPWRTNRARALRSRATSAESKLWFELRGRRLGGHKFVRQAPIGPYFVDFVCRERMLVVEIDGATHATPEEIVADELRASAIAALGYRIHCAWNGDVYDNMTGVLETIRRRLEEG